MTTLQTLLIDSLDNTLGHNLRTLFDMKGIKMSKSYEIFSELVKHFSYKGKGNGLAPLCNLTFFMGAGFSKSWDENFPTGYELFSFKYEDWSTQTVFLEGYLHSHGYDESKDLTPELFKELIYQLGMYIKYPDIRPRYIDEGNIKLVEKELRALVFHKFKQTARIYEFNEEKAKIEIDHALSAKQKEIIAFFHSLNKHTDGSQGLAEGIRTNFITTNYDSIIEAILDNSIGPDDSLFLHTYRGVTPNKIRGFEAGNVIHDNWVVSNLFKINGGFEVFKNDDGYEFNYLKKDNKNLRSNPPQIMLPSNEQDYTQDYFKSIFPKAIRLLQESKILVIVGYSLPEEDALLRFLAKQFAEDNADGDRKFLFYIDLSSEEDQSKKVKRIFPQMNDVRGLDFVPYSGSFTGWIKKVNL